jgi:FAD/FMN-containing dehydrogenase/SAM-dependent methyltransferase
MASTVIPGFGGTVIRPGQPGYDAARQVWNAMHDRRPALIARPASARDVAAAIRYARAEGLLIAVRAGGHSMPGHSVCDGGLVIDLRALNQVRVDSRARRAWVGGGALLGEVDRATQEHGLVLPAGVVSHTGAGGLTLGGGVGRLMRRYGLTIDSLLAAEVVTADGAIVRASAGEHADLFWALRGGGGNFGVVTGFEFALHELSELVILATFHPLEQARRVIEHARREMADPATPDELLWTSFLRRASDVPWMPPELVGRHGIMSLIEWSGDAAGGRAVLAGIRDELQPAVSDLSVVPFLFMQTITDDLFGHGLRTYIKAGFAGDLPDGLIDTLIGRAAELRSPISQVELLALGGAIARVDPGATAFGFRKARWLINIPATWRDAADDEREIAWARATYAAVKPFLSEGTYVNFMGDDEDEGAAGAYGRTIERLQRVKAAYDPDNVFRLNQNITPVSAAAQVQRHLWGTDPRAWADLAEVHNQPLFEAVLDAAGAGPGTRLLDVGCGSGLTLELAARRGAVPSGLDISPGLLGIARARLPAADLRDGDMESLPFGDDAFDAVVGVNAFQFAGDPRRALREAARVTRPGGRVVASLFAAPERSQGTVVHEAMSALIPPDRAGDHAPYALSAPGNLEAALAGAGLRVMDHGEVVCWWRYAGLEDAVRALLCSAGGARAVQSAGEQEVRDVLERALAPFQDPRTGTVALRNTFRWVAAVRLAGLRCSRPFFPGHPFLHGQRGEQVVQPGDEGGRVVDPGAEGEHCLVEQHGRPVRQARVVRPAVEPFHQRVRRVDLEHRLARQARPAQPHGQADVGLGLVGHEARGGGGQPARHADVPDLVAQCFL